MACVHICQGEDMRVLLLFLTLLLAGPLQANPFEAKPDFLPVT